MIWIVEDRSDRYFGIINTETGQRVRTSLVAAENPRLFDTDNPRAKAWAGKQTRIAQDEADRRND